MINQSLDIKGTIKEDPIDPLPPKTPTIQMAAILFSVAVYLLVFFASYFQGKGFVSGVLVTEYIFVLLPPLLCAKYFNMDIRRVFRFNKVSITNLSLSVGIMLFSLPLVSVVNAVYPLTLKKIFGDVNVFKIPTAQDSGELLLFFFIIGVSAGICEEVLFRGFIMRGMEAFGTKKAILISGILFGFIHLSLDRLLGTFLLGLVIGFLVYRTNSIFTGMMAHFANNTLATFISYMATTGENAAASQGLSGAPSLDTLFGNGKEKVLLILFFVVFTLGLVSCCLSILYFLVKALMKNTRDVSYADSQPSQLPKDAKNILWLTPGALLVLYILIREGAELFNAPLPSLFQ